MLFWYCLQIFLVTTTTRQEYSVYFKWTDMVKVRNEVKFCYIGPGYSKFRTIAPFRGGTRHCYARNKFMGVRPTPPSVCRRRIKTFRGLRDLRRHSATTVGKEKVFRNRWEQITMKSFDPNNEHTGLASLSPFTVRSPFLTENISANIRLKLRIFPDRRRYTSLIIWSRGSSPIRSALVPPLDQSITQSIRIVATVRNEN
jgi:hypothetical protein